MAIFGSYFSGRSILDMGYQAGKGINYLHVLWLGNYHGKRFTCLKKNEEFGVSMTSGKSKIRT